MTDPYEKLRSDLEMMRGIASRLSKSLGAQSHRQRAEAASIAAFAAVALAEVDRLRGIQPGRRPHVRKVAPVSRELRPLAPELMDQVRAAVSHVGKVGACRRLGITMRTLNRVISTGKAQVAVQERIRSAFDVALQIEGEARGILEGDYDSLLGDLEDAAGLTAALRD